MWRRAVGLRSPVTQASFGETRRAVARSIRPRAEARRAAPRAVLKPALRSLLTLSDRAQVVCPQKRYGFEQMTGDSRKRSDSARDGRCQRDALEIDAASREQTMNFAPSNTSDVGV